MNMIKKTLLVLGLFAASYSASFGQTVMSSNSLAGTNTLLVGRYGISSVTLLSTGATTVLFYDTASRALTYTNPEYRILTNTNAVNFEVIFTNSLGNLATSYYSGPYYWWHTNVANTNASPSFASIAVEANTPISIPVNWYVGQGLTIKNTAALPGQVSITLLYK